MPIIFRAKTKEGFATKVLAELLQNNIKTGCFEIDKTGIFLRMMDHHRNTLIDITLPRDKFCLFKFKPKDRMSIGINLTHFHKMLKSIKKKDSIELSIDDDNPTDLDIKVIPKENNRVTKSTIKIQNTQNIDIDLPEGYDRPVLVPSGEFQKMCKGLTHISNVTDIYSKGFMIRFSSDAGGVMKRETEFGEREEDEEKDEEDEYNEEEYHDTFDTEQLTRIAKLAGLSTTMQIFPLKDNPLLFRSNIGLLGEISIYIKSKTLQDDEARAVESECE